ncbi:hypothetical protein GCM10009087_46690 [Sphingomonas oligophenolica]|uniref:Flavodoxin n=1 Tax=Sphingomonas oligophenolica TaxID=301154 RepID=A0ABU9Y9F9_9SPHN
MTRTLVVFYSRTGHVRTVAKLVADACGADLEEIRDVRPRHGMFGWLRSAREARRGDLPEIAALQHDPADYDLVVLGTPVWASAMASPMRSFLSEQGSRCRAIATFCTMGGRGGDTALKAMASLCAKAPVGRMILTDAELKSATLSRKVADFVRSFP